MSGPTTILDFGVLKLGDGATPTEVFTAVCLTGNVSISRSAQTSDQFLRDCTKPNAVATKRTRVTNTSYSVQFSGIPAKSQIAILEGAFAKKKNFIIEAKNDDSTDQGVLQATWTGGGIMTSLEWSLDQDGESQFSATIDGSGPLPYAVAL